MLRTPARVIVDVHERIAINSVFALPADGEPGSGFLEMKVLRITIACQARRQVILRIEQPAPLKSNQLSS